MNRTDRAWLVELLKQYDHIEIEIKLGKGYTTEQIEYKKMFEELQGKFNA
jgi:hypothetical protein